MEGRGFGGERLWGANLLLFSGKIGIFLGTGDGWSGTHLGGLRGLRCGGRRCGGSCRGSLRGGDASPLRVPFHALAAALSGDCIPRDPARLGGESRGAPGISDPGSRALRGFVARSRVGV